MTHKARAGWVALLCLFGAGWGLTQPLAKIATSTGYKPFGIIFWQMMLGAVLLAAINLARRGRWPLTGRALRVYLVIALLGTLVPNYTFYAAIPHLPAGILSILVATVPMFAFPLAILFREDRFSILRLIGLICGATGVLLILLPETSLPPGTPVIFVLIALAGEVCYALEGIYVSKAGTTDLDALEVLMGASVVGAALVAPVALATGQFIAPIRPIGTPEWALIGLSVLHTLIYMGYVWMVGRTGAVFSAQVSYLVTAFGLLWAMALLGERYAPTVWAAFALMLAGMALVSPRAASLDSASPNRDDGDRINQG